VVALMWSDLAVVMNTPTKIGIGAYLAISFAFDIWSGICRSYVILSSLSRSYSSFACFWV
jgi:hypothetical protein